MSTPDMPGGDEKRANLKPLSGSVRRLESTLMLKTWKKFYYSLEDDKLCFYKDQQELDHSEFIDLSKVTSIKNNTYSPKPKEDEKWQIEITTSDKKVYLCCDDESDQISLTKGLQNWSDYFLAEHSTTARESKMDQLPQSFNISNSEKQNAQNLKGYYAQLRRADSGLKSPLVSRGSIGPTTGATPNDSPNLNLGSQSAENGPSVRNSIQSVPKSSSPRDFPTNSKKEDLMSDPKEQVGRVGTPTQSLSLSSDSASGGTSVSQISLDDNVELQREEIVALNLKLKQSLDHEIAYKKEIEQLKNSLAEKEMESKKQLEEMSAGFEAKKRGFNFIVNSKDFEIEKLRQEKQKMNDAKVKELEDLIALRDREITELKTKLNDKEIEILERKENELNLEAKHEQVIASLNKEANKKLTELQDSFSSLKDRYFFSLALSVKMASPNGSALDLNALYDRCLREQIPFDQWQEWLNQFANENERVEGEEENVENF